MPTIGSKFLSLSGSYETIYSVSDIRKNGKYFLVESDDGTEHWIYRLNRSAYPDIKWFEANI